MGQGQLLDGAAAEAKTPPRGDSREERRGGPRLRSTGPVTPAVTQQPLLRQNGTGSDTATESAKPGRWALPSRSADPPNAATGQVTRVCAHASARSPFLTLVWGCGRRCFSDTGRAQLSQPVGPGGTCESPGQGWRDSATAEELVPSHHGWTLAHPHEQEHTWEKAG